MTRELTQDDWCVLTFVKLFRDDATCIVKDTYNETYTNGKDVTAALYAGYQTMLMCGLISNDDVEECKATFDPKLGVKQWQNWRTNPPEN